MDFQWQTILISVLSTIIVALITWGSERLITFLNGKIKNSKMLQYSTTAVSLVTNAVKSTYQTYVEGLKGKNLFDKDAQKEALGIALDKTLSQMPNDIKQYIENNFGDLNSWIVTQVEAVLYDLKNKIEK